MGNFEILTYQEMIEQMFELVQDILQISLVMFFLSIQFVLINYILFRKMVKLNNNVTYMQYTKKDKKTYKKIKKNKDDNYEEN